MAALRTRNYPTVRALVPHIPTLVSASSRDGEASAFLSPCVGKQLAGERERLECTPLNHIPMVQQYAPQLEKRCRPHLRPTNDSWRADETYIKIKGKDRYLYRAVDSTGQTLDFLLTAHRDAIAAKRFLCKALKAVHNQEPRLINVDKNAAYPKAMDDLKEKEELSKGVELRQNKYLNNRIEQDHRFIKRLVKPGRGFGSFNTARRTIKGYDVMNMLRKGQVKKVGKGAVRERVKFIAEIFGVAA